MIFYLQKYGTFGMLIEKTILFFNLSLKVPVLIKEK